MFIYTLRSELAVPTTTFPPGKGMPPHIMCRLLTAEHSPEPYLTSWEWSRTLCRVLSSFTTDPHVTCSASSLPCPGHQVQQRPSKRSPNPARSIASPAPQPGFSTTSLNISREPINKRQQARAAPLGFSANHRSEVNMWVGAKHTSRLVAV